MSIDHGYIPLSDKDLAEALWEAAEGLGENRTAAEIVESLEVGYGMPTLVARRVFRIAKRVIGR